MNIWFVCPATFFLGAVVSTMLFVAASMNASQISQARDAHCRQFAMMRDNQAGPE